tara:strand:+ start:1093 stop:1545 length:453 start_codon:yes stop_codon:yes gene_type:complete
MLVKNHNQGQISEALFRNLCERDYIDIEKSSRYEDRYEHIDFYVKLKTQVRSIDIKSTKKINGKLQDDYFYIEIKNDNGNKGWLYAPNMCLVGFECFDAYRIYRRDKILDYINSKGVNKFEPRTRYKDKSLCILLPRKDIEHLIYYTLYK